MFVPAAVIGELAPGAVTVREPRLDLQPFTRRPQEVLLKDSVVNGILLPITLCFVWRLAANRKLMGEYANGRSFNILAGATVIATSALSLLLLGVTIAGG